MTYTCEGEHAVHSITVTSCMLRNTLSTLSLSFIFSPRAQYSSHFLLPFSIYLLLVLPRSSHQPSLLGPGSVAFSLKNLSRVPYIQLPKPRHLFLESAFSSLAHPGFWPTTLATLACSHLDPTLTWEGNASSWGAYPQMTSKSASWGSHSIRTLCPKKKYVSWVTRHSSSSSQPEVGLTD